MFDLAHWFTPAPLDTQAWDVAERSNDRATFRDRGHSFTIPAGRNSFYNPSLKATGKL